MRPFHYMTVVEGEKKEGAVHHDAFRTIRPELKGRASSKRPRYERNQEQHQEHKKQNLGDAG